MGVKQWPESERPREKLMKYGVKSLSNAELIALIIRSGTKETSALSLAEEILTQEQGISSLGNMEPEEYCRIRGIGVATACTLTAAVELGKRIAAASARERLSIRRSDDIAKLFMEDLRYEKKEHFKSLLLSAKGDIISIEHISTGELSSTVVHPREVFSMAVRKSAAAVVFVHNHPSGDAMPSQEDVETTRRLTDCGVLLGIRVLDHIIIGDGYFSSMKEMGYIK